MPKGQYFLAIGDDGLIKRRAYYKGVEGGWTPKGNWAAELEDHTETENIGKVSQSPELWMRNSKGKFERRKRVHVTNQKGGKIVEIGDSATIIFKNVPEDIKTFKVQVGDKEVELQNGEPLEVTALQPSSISVRLIEPALYQRTPYTVVFVPKRRSNDPTLP